MMKEVEEGKKLRHVQCNDRSNPIIQSKSVTKIQGQFIFETEATQKDTKLDALLKEIQGGIKLKSVKCNDRSKPVLDGLRKFRRQMTLEEQLQKSESKINLDAMPPSVVDEDEGEDEIDDVDKLRDDLQSTKQLLAMELRNKEAQERENKRLLTRIQNLEAELGRARENSGSAPTNGAVTKAFGEDDPLVKALKKESEEAQRQSKMLEKKYSDAAEKLDIAKAELEEQKKLISKFMAQVVFGVGWAFFYTFEAKFLLYIFWKLLEKHEFSPFGTYCQPDMCGTRTTLHDFWPKTNLTLINGPDVEIFEWEGEAIELLRSKNRPKKRSYDKAILFFMKFHHLSS